MSNCDGTLKFYGSLVNYLDRTYPFVHGNDDCGSPIEKMMFMAIKLIGQISHPGRFFVEKQKHIGPYRVDLLISYTHLDGDKCHKVVVECDGHDFHEKTRIQASSDKKRDRFLQKEGYSVLRYSGSDVWKDSFLCAEEVFDFLRSKTAKAEGDGK